MAARRPLMNTLRQKPFARVSSRYHAFSWGMGDVQLLALPHITDIFDAPTRLEVTKGRQSSQQASSAPVVSTTIASSNPALVSKGLPAPLLFEGPAQPRSSFSLLLTKPPRRTAERGHNRSNKLPSMYQNSTSIPLSINQATMYTYDGPSNMTRYRYRGQKKKNDDGRKPLLALVSLATLAAGGTICLDL